MKLPQIATIAVLVLTLVFDSASSTKRNPFNHKKFTLEQGSEEGQLGKSQNDHRKDSFEEEWVILYTSKHALDTNPDALTEDEFNLDEESTHIEEERSGSSISSSSESHKERSKYSFEFEQLGAKFYENLKDAKKEEKNRKVVTMTTTTTDYRKRSIDSHETSHKHQINSNNDSIGTLKETQRVDGLSTVVMPLSLPVNKDKYENNHEGDADGKTVLRSIFPKSSVSFETTSKVVTMINPSSSVLTKCTSSCRYLVFEPLPKRFASLNRYFTEPLPKPFAQIISRLADPDSGLLVSICADNSLFFDFLHDDDVYGDQKSLLTLVRRFCMPNISGQSSRIVDAALKGWYLVVLIDNSMKAWNLENLKAYRKSCASSSLFKTKGYHVLEIENKQLLVLDFTFPWKDSLTKDVKISFDLIKSQFQVYIWSMSKVLTFSLTNDKDETELQLMINPKSMIPQRSLSDKSFEQNQLLEKKSTGDHGNVIIEDMKMTFPSTQSSFLISWNIESREAEVDTINFESKKTEATLRVFKKTLENEQSVFQLDAHELFNRQPGLMLLKGTVASKFQGRSFLIYEGGTRFNKATLVNSLLSETDTKEIKIQRLILGLFGDLPKHYAFVDNEKLLINGPWRAIFSQDSKSMHVWNVLSGQCRQFSNLALDEPYNPESVKLNPDGGWSCLTMDNMALLVQFGTHQSMYCKAQTLSAKIKIKDYHVHFKEIDGLLKLDKVVFIDLEDRVWLRDYHFSYYSYPLDKEKKIQDSVTLLKDPFLSDKKFSKVEWVGSNADILAVHTTSETVLYDARRVWDEKDSIYVIQLKQIYHGNVSKINHVDKQATDFVFLLHKSGLTCLLVNKSKPVGDKDKKSTLTCIAQKVHYSSINQIHFTENEVLNFVVLEKKLLTFTKYGVDFYELKGREKETWYMNKAIDKCLLWDTDSFQDAHSIKIHQCIYQNGSKLIIIGVEEIINTGSSTKKVMVQSIKNYLIK